MCRFIDDICLVSTIKLPKASLKLASVKVDCTMTLISVPSEPTSGEHCTMVPMGSLLSETKMSPFLGRGSKPEAKRIIGAK